MDNVTKSTATIAERQGEQRRFPKKDENAPINRASGLL